MRSFVFGLAALAGVLPLAAQAPADTSAMAKLAWLAGEWQGTGSMMTGPGQQREGSIVERASFHAGGHALTFEGLGKAAGAGGDSIVVHNAFGMIWHDGTAYRLKAFRANGHSVEPQIEVSDGKVVWAFDERVGRIRFTVSHLPDGRWHEIGEMSRDGTTWMKFMEMSLTRVEKQAHAGH